jgi:hypothetical protein
MGEWCLIFLTALVKYMLWSERCSMIVNVDFERFRKEYIVAKFKKTPPPPPETEGRSSDGPLTTTQSLLLGQSSSHLEM